MTARSDMQGGSAHRAGRTRADSRRRL